MGLRPFEAFQYEPMIQTEGHNGIQIVAIHFIYNRYEGINFPI